MELSTINHAVKLVRDKFRIDLSVSRCSVQEDTLIDSASIRYRTAKRLEMTITVAGPYNEPFWNAELDYAIFISDLDDGSLIDEIIGGDIRGYDPEVRQVLRLAFILYNGIQYGMKREQKTDYLDKGWHPRVVEVRGCL